MRYQQLIFMALLCSMAIAVTAQVSTPKQSAMYTNRVSRLVYIGDTSALGQKRQNSLAEVLTKMVLDGKLQAYGTFDSRFAEKRSASQIKARLYPVDSIEIEDPVTGKRFFRVVTTQVDFNQIWFMRILEEWAYDAESGTTHIQIVGIAPVRNEYGEDGTFRGQSSMYWLKFTDVQPILDQYEKDHPDQLLSKAIWANYFE